MSNKITVEVSINQGIEKIWDCFNNPEHITKWNSASGDWHTPRAVNDLRVNGSFCYRMEARDNSAGFDFTGIYDEVKEREEIRYTMEDGRQVQVLFRENDHNTVITENFDPENTYPPEYQKEGWQSILNHLKEYAESL